jgi:hypothetical protein
MDDRDKPVNVQLRNYGKLDLPEKVEELSDDEFIAARAVAPPIGYRLGNSALLLCRRRF